MQTKEDRSDPSSKKVWKSLANGKKTRFKDLQSMVERKPFLRDIEM